MPLRHRLRELEIVQELEEARHERYWEGLELMGQSYLGSGIYLMGYSAEMTLKLASFRFTGSLATEEVRGLLLAARLRSRAYILSTRGDSFHSLLFWVDLLCQDRTRQGKPLGIEPKLRTTATRLAVNWTVEMRYQPDCATIADAEEVIADVDWIRRNFTSLWR